MNMKKEISISAWKRLIASFDNTTKGFSARKLSAFAGVNIAMLLSFKLGTPENGTYIVGIWLTFSLLCLGIVTAEQLLMYLKGDVNKQTEQQPQQSENLEEGK